MIKIFGVREEREERRERERGREVGVTGKETKIG